MAIDTGSHAINYQGGNSQQQTVLDNDQLSSDWASYFPAPADGAYDRINDAFSGNGTGGTMVDNLSPACRKLVDGIQDLLRYKEDAQLAEAILPELIKMLKSSDPEVVKDGAKGIDELRKKEAMRHALVRNPDLCPTIGQVLNNPNTSDDVKKTLLGTLNNMTDTDAGRRAIFNGLTIPVLVKMLGDLNKKIVQYALSTLHSLEYHMPAEVVGPIRLAGGVGKMSEVLVDRKASPHNPWSDKFLSLLLNSLEILCIKDNGSKTIFVSKNGLPALVGIIQNCTVQNQPYENLAYTAIRFFCVLSAYCTIKEKIIEEGGMEAASGLYEVPIVFKKHIRLTALWALRNLSDKADTEGETMVNLLVACLEILNDGTSEDSMKECAVGILSNLTCNNSTNKEAVIGNDGVAILINTILAASSNLSIKEPAVCALRHLTSRNVYATRARDEVGGSAIIPMVKEALRMPEQMTHAHMGYIRAITSLIRNIAHAPSAQKLIAKEHIVEEICILLQDVDRHNDAANHTVKEYDLDGVIEGCIGALHACSIYDELRRILSAQTTQEGNPIVLYLAKFMTSSSIVVQRESVGCLAELAQDPENKRLLVENKVGGHTIIQWLGNLLHSPTEQIATYAAVTLYAIDDQTKENTKQTIEKGMFENELDTIHEYDDEQSALISSNHPEKENGIQQNQYGDSDL